MAATEQTVRIWKDYRTEIARDYLRLLKVGKQSGAFRRAPEPVQAAVPDDKIRLLLARFEEALQRSDIEQRVEQRIEKRKELPWLAKLRRHPRQRLIPSHRPSSNGSANISGWSRSITRSSAGAILSSLTSIMKSRNLMPLLTTNSTSSSS